MRLIRYKVSNFRSVIDSGWIEVDRVAALVGVNESGKSNLLLPLWKLNPAGEASIRPTSDFPKRSYAAVRANPGQYEFIAADFEIPELLSKLGEMTGPNSQVLEVVRVRRYLNGEYSIEFPNYIPVEEHDNTSVKAILEQAKTEISNLTALTKEGAIKKELTNALTAAIAETEKSQTLSAVDLEKISAQLSAAVPQSVATTSSIVPRFKSCLDEIGSLNEALSVPPPSETEGVYDLILKHIPKFVYYSNYGNLDSEIYLPHVVENLRREDLGAREEAKARTLRVLFDFVKLQPHEILELGRDFRNPERRNPTESEIQEIATKKRDRTILLNSAGTDLTLRFKNWWKQGNYTFEFQADGDHFRIWVSDKVRPEKVELEDRSSGLQWFFSFYLIFLVERSGDHRDAVLLLDEPGLSLHPLAQRDLSAFFEGLADTNQIIYTTHSPYLVDADMLDRARKVYVDEDGSTKASSDLRRGSDDPRKLGATYAVYSALNMNIAESLLLGCQPVIVEGPSDQHYLTTIKTLLIASKRINPKNEIVFPPCHGAKNAKVVASIITGRDEILPMILFDGDEAGKRMAQDLKNGSYKDAKNRIHLTDDYVGFPNSEIEDLFPTDFIADVVDRWQRNSDTAFNEVVEKEKPLIPQIEKWASSQKIVLESGWKVDLSRAVKKRALALGIDKFPDELLDRWTKLFLAFQSD